MPTHPFDRLKHAVFTSDANQSLRITRSLMAARVYLICLALAIYEGWAGFMSWDEVGGLGTVMVANVLLWYGLLRSGLNRRWPEPALTLPQLLAALTLIAAAYTVTGPVHGAIMMLLCLVLVFGIFKLRSRAAKFAGIYTLLLMSAVMFWKAQTEPSVYPWKLQVAHFILMVAIVPTISALSGQLNGLHRRLKAQKQELQQALERIQILATRDALTGLINRRHVIEVLAQHRSRLERSGHHPFSVALLDLDFFKQVNDTHGHGVGDEVLRHFASQARLAIREVDVLARWGGEEFLLILVDTAPEQAQLSIERVRQRLAQHPLVQGELRLDVRFSAGLTAFDHLNKESIDECIDRADRALYQAKADGRNRTRILLAAEAPPVQRPSAA